MWRSAQLSAWVLVFVAGCATVPTPPTIQRLPDGAAGPIAKPSLPTPAEIVDLTRSGTPSDLIIQKLRDAGAAHAFTAEQVSSLASRGVAPEVIAYLRYGENGITPPVYAPIYPPAAYPAYPYPYGYRPYGLYAPYWGYPYGPFYPGSSFSLGFSRRW